MFKIGMKLRAIDNYESYGRHYIHLQGDIIMVDGIDINTKTYQIRNVSNGATCNWGFHGEDYFKVISDSPKTELEWLDRIQENFKDG